MGEVQILLHLSGRVPGLVESLGRALPISRQEKKWCTGHKPVLSIDSKHLSAHYPFSSSWQPEMQVLLSPHFADEDTEAQTV